MYDIYIDCHNGLVAILFYDKVHSESLVREQKTYILVSAPHSWHRALKTLVIS